jgi:hypothetical protein
MELEMESPMPKVSAVRNTIGPYPVVCVEVEKIGPTGLINWIKSHDTQMRIDLLDHVLRCHRCKEVHKNSLRLVKPMSPEEFQATFDLAVCSEVASHRGNLIDWLYSIRGTKLFYDVQDHLGICDRCPATLKEMGEALEVPED